jgi:hypothetical protein
VFGLSCDEVIMEMKDYNIKNIPSESLQGGKVRHVVRSFRLVGVTRLLKKNQPTRPGQNQVKMAVVLKV